MTDTETDAYNAAHNVVAIIQALRTDPNTAAQYIASMTHPELALALHAAAIDLLSLWTLSANQAGITFDEFVARVVESIDDQEANQ